MNKLIKMEITYEDHKGEVKTKTIEGHRPAIVDGDNKYTTGEAQGYYVMDSMARAVEHFGDRINIPGHEISWFKVWFAPVGEKLNFSEVEAYIHTINPPIDLTKPPIDISAKEFAAQYGKPV